MLGAKAKAVGARIGSFGRRVFEHREWLSLYAVAVACDIATVVLFYPGYMSRDSVVQLGQARTLLLVDHHPISMALIWHVVDKVVPGPLGMLVLASSLYWLGLSAICRSLRWPLWLRALALIAVGFFPPVFCIVGAIWKDSLMMGALLAALGCFIAFARSKSRGVLALGIVLSILALLLRHNAIAAVWPVIALPILSAPWMLRRKLPSRLLLGGVVSMAAAATLLVLFTKLLAPFAERAEFWQLIATYDLAGMSVRNGKLLMDKTNAPMNDGITFRDVRRNYRAENQLSLYYCLSRRYPCRVVFRRCKDAAELSALSTHWKRTVLENPRLYLEHRYDVYRHVVGLDHPTKLWYPHAGGVSRQYPLSARTSELLRWFRQASRTPWFSIWIYVVLDAVLAVVGLAFYAFTRSALPMVLALSGLSYSVSLFFGAGTPDYRYSTWSVMTAVLASIAILQPWKPAGVARAYPPREPSSHDRKRWFQRFFPRRTRAT